MLAGKDLFYLSSTLEQNSILESKKLITDFQKRKLTIFSLYLQDTKMDLLVTHLDTYSRLGIPKLHHLVAFEAEDEVEEGKSTWEPFQKILLKKAALPKISGLGKTRTWRTRRTRRTM
jgi:hypothetical protein